MSAEKCCSNCMYSVPDWTNSDNSDHYCNNEESELYGYNVEWIDGCDNWDSERGSDLISRQAAIDAIHEDILLKPLNDSFYRENHEFVTVGYVERTLLAVPSAQPERKKGRWVQSNLDKEFLTCSCCRTENLKMRMAYRRDYANIFLYCPNCGAEMEGDRDATD